MRRARLLMRMRYLLCRVGIPAAVSANSRMQRLMIWRWGICMLKLLNLCCLNLLALRCKNILIRLMLVPTMVILDIRSRSHHMAMSLNSMDTVVRSLEYHLQGTRPVLTRHRAITLLLLLHQELRESLLVVRGGRFESFSFVLVASCIEVAFPSCVSNRKRWRCVFFFWIFSLYPPNYTMSEGQVAGSSCPSSLVVLFLIPCIPAFNAVLLSSYLPFPSLSIHDCHFCDTLPTATRQA